MEHEYQKMMNQVRVPEGLNGRVLFAARQQEAERSGRSSRRRSRPLFRTAVCAACALALVAGGLTLRPAESGEEKMEFVESLPVPALTLSYDFALTASAAEISGSNGGVVLSSSDGEPQAMISIGRPDEQKRGSFTDSRFQIQGEGIKTVTLSIDRGGLYRVKAGEEPVLLARGEAVNHDPEVLYGLWIPPEYVQNAVDFPGFDGASLTITAGFANGVSKTEVYHLTAERLRIFENEDGGKVLIPALEGDGEAERTGLYAVPADSTWFHWPVEGSNTVSLSNDYGYRHAPGGQGGTFHAGIDIPGETGMPILAAESGTVTETGFDAERGNYLIIDHGDDLTTLYGQCRELLAEEGDTVEAGETIAALGSTGMSTGPHLHFEVRQDGEAQNPVAYFDSEIRDTLRAE